VAATFQFVAQHRKTSVTDYWSQLYPEACTPLLAA
jgi:hypothetical protein